VQGEAEVERAAVSVVDHEHAEVLVGPEIHRADESVETPGMEQHAFASPPRFEEPVRDAGHPRVLRELARMHDREGRIGENAPTIHAPLEMRDHETGHVARRGAQVCRRHDLRVDDWSRYHHATPCLVARRASLCDAFGEAKRALRHSEWREHVALHVVIERLA